MGGVNSWEDLKFWDSGEWQVIQEKLDDMDRAKKKYNPKREDLFAALYATPLEKVKVAFFGQDPYPDATYATGLAFSIPKEVKRFPPTLVTILNEYSSDLHYPLPLNGDLSSWASEGVLLWNVVPTCSAGLSLSHDWEEWRYLTTEIIEVLRDRGIVFVFIGSRAREYAHLIKGYGNCAVVETAHPSPRAHFNKRLKHPFIGSRLFSTINSKLVDLGLDPVNWRL